MSHDDQDKRANVTSFGAFRQSFQILVLVRIKAAFGGWFAQRKLMNFISSEVSGRDPLKLLRY
ncbi:hypothetical protein SLEP1_g12037 [Rubroshorea leprosula]|nr:hypothetical protein SLEP1_g12037 [Rubroshorea leprosula]